MTNTKIGPLISLLAVRTVLFGAVISAGAQDILDPFTHSGKGTAPSEVPADLRSVHAEWEVDAAGRVIGVDFDSTNGVYGPNPSIKQLQHLVEIKYLQKFNGPGDTVTDEWMKVVGKLRNLRELTLIHASITDAGTEHLRELKEMRRLWIQYSEIGDLSATRFADFEKLEELDLRSTGISNLGILQLAHLKNLRVLRIGSYFTPNDIGPKGLFASKTDTALGKMKSLRTLEFDRTSYSEPTVETLRKSLPDCDIILDQRSLGAKNSPQLEP